MAYSTEERKFIENNRDLIDSRNMRELFNKIWGDGETSFKRSQGEYSAKKLIFVISYVLYGPGSFRIRVEDRGKSRNVHRANAGQKIMRWNVEAKIHDGKFFTVTYLKGTLNPNSISWRDLRAPLKKALIGLTTQPFDDVLVELEKEFAHTGGKYDV